MSETTDLFGTIKRVIQERNARELEEQRWTRRYTLRNGVVITLRVPESERESLQQLWKDLEKQ